MYYGTVTPQPVQIHVTRFFWVVIHQPDGRTTPRDGCLPPVFVSHCECLLCTEPPFVGGEKLKIALDVIQHCVPCVVDVRLQIVDVPLQATVNVAA